MFPKINPTTTPSWQALQQHKQLFENVQMKDLFFNDAERFDRFSIKIDDILFDYSKNMITENTVEILLELAADCKLNEAIEAKETPKESLERRYLRHFQK